MLWMIDASHCRSDLLRQSLCYNRLIHKDRESHYGSNKNANTSKNSDLIQHLDAIQVMFVERFLLIKWDIEIAQNK